MISLSIDDRSITVAEGTTIWEAAREQGISIPVLCHQPRLDPVGVCRMCVVDVGGRTLAASCVRTCEQGMRVQTSSEKVESQRRMLTALLLDEHPIPCQRESTTGDCELEALGRRYGLIDQGKVRSPLSVVRSKNNLSASSHQSRTTNYGLRTTDYSSKVIAVDHQACILCDRCIRACNDIQCNEVIGRAGKGIHTRIGFDLDVPMGQSTCVSCGECAASCPTGALTHKAITLPLTPRRELTAIPSVCPYCGVGCTTTYYVRGQESGVRNQESGIRSQETEGRGTESGPCLVLAEGREGPGSQGRLCVKGRYGWDYTLHGQRLTTPLIRKPEYYPKAPFTQVTSSGKGRAEGNQDALTAFRATSWDEALDLAAQRFLAIKKQHGPGALAGFGSAKCSNEEAYLFQKLVRTAFGTNNVDHCTRLCHASSVAALLEGIGSGAVTDVFANARRADLILLTGTNTTANHPVAATFFKQAAKRGTRIIVIDPRRPDIADFAHWYCRIKPGTDVAFYNSLMKVLIEENLIDRDFIARRTENFEALKIIVQDYPPERVGPLCGIDAEVLKDIARAIGRAKNMMIFWGMGISQHTHGTDNSRCLIALCLLTGQVGRPGTGLHPLRGQNNVQGASDAGLIPMVYPDYQPVENDEIRRKFEKAWGVPLDPRRGLTVVEIMKGALEGRIRGMLMLGENPFLSDPNINKVKKALANLEFLVVQDIFLTETAEFADVVLPASSFFEKTGTYTNTDRRVQIGRTVLPPPGQARLDWQVLCDLSTRMGFPMEYESPEEIFAEFARLTESYRGLDYSALGETGKIWPIARAGDPETPVLFGDRFPTPSGKGKFVPAVLAPPAELPDDEFPFVLNTGRVLEHWHTGTMTRRSQALDALAPEPFVEVHPDDLVRLAARDGDFLTVRSRRGAITLKARADARVSVGNVFIPFHFHEAAANVLTIDELDPYGKIPEFKFCAVRLEKLTTDGTNSTDPSRPASKGSV